MGKIVVGKVAFTPKGEWSSEEIYSLYDMVYQDLLVYISLVDNNTSPLSDTTSWRRLMGIEKVLGRMLADGAVTTDKIQDGAVTGDDFSGESVTRGKIADDAVQARNIKDRNVTHEKIADDAVQTRNIKDQHVTKEKLKDGDISWDKLDENVQNLIATGGGQHGVPFATEFGGSDEIGISQRALTESRDSLQAQIDAIVGGGATVNLTANKTTVFVSEQTALTLTATCSKAATSIVISGGNLSPAVSGSGQNLVADDIITPAAPGTTTYNASFVIAGQTRTATRSITAVYPIYYGAGMVQGDVLDVSACRTTTARTTPTANYTVTVADSAKYIWFFVPSNMQTQITSAKMGGFDFPLETLADVTDDAGVLYKVYRTPNTNEVGTYVISINPSN